MHVHEYINTYIHIHMGIILNLGGESKRLGLTLNPLTYRVNPI